MNAQFCTIKNIFKRLEHIENPWKDFEASRKSIKKAKKELNLLMKSKN
jgi:hypothetical protein